MFLVTKFSQPVYLMKWLQFLSVENELYNVSLLKYFNITVFIVLTNPTTEIVKLLA